MKSGKSGGMVFTIDMIASLFFFMLIILSLLWVWQDTQRRARDYESDFRESDRLLRISSLLVGGGGSPRNWEKKDPIDVSDIMALGLASEPNVIDHEKARAMEGLDYEDVRVLLGMGSSDFRLTITRYWKGEPAILHELGGDFERANRLVMRRYALYNGTRVEVKFEVGYG
jgi:cbb3-type cytochrome oxidase subunit 3